MDLKSKIVDCISENMGMNFESINSLNEDESLSLIGMDSRNCMDIVICLEEKFGISIEGDDLVLEKLDTLHKLVGIVQKKI